MENNPNKKQLHPPKPEVIQTSQGDMFIEYMVGEVEVTRSVDTGEIKCRTCNSGNCTHVEKVKAYLMKV